MPPTATRISLYPGTVPAATQLTVVSMAARGRTLQAIADATTLPISTVQAIGRHFGAPNLGTLTNAAEALRAHLERNGHPAAPGTASEENAVLGIHPALHDIRTAAEQLGARRLVRRVDAVTAQIDQLHVDLDAAREAQAARAEEKARAEKARRAKVAQLEKSRATAADLAAQLKAETTKAARIEAELRRLTPEERGRVRLWAAEAKLDCPAIGPIPKAVITAWTEAGRP